jgi:hypothetical protein
MMTAPTKRAAIVISIDESARPEAATEPELGVEPPVGAAGVSLVGAGTGAVAGASEGRGGRVGDPMNTVAWQVVAS